MIELHNNVSNDTNYSEKLDQINKSEWGTLIRNETLLQRVLYRKHTQCALKLLTEPEFCNINHINLSGDTALIIACMHDLGDIVLMILDHMDISLISNINKCKMTALSWCVHNSSEALTNKILSCTTALSDYDKNKIGTSFYKIMSTMPDFAHNILSSPEDYNLHKVLDNGDTLLINLCNNVTSLTDNYIRTLTANVINEPNSKGETALIVACRNKAEMITLELLRILGTDINEDINKPNSSLLISCKNNMTNTMHEIIKGFRNKLNMVDSNGHTLLMNLFLWNDNILPETKRIDLILTLLEYPYELGLDMADDCGMSVIMYACSPKSLTYARSNLLIIKKLLKHPDKLGMEYINNSGYDIFDIVLKNPRYDLIIKSFIEIMISDPEKYNLWRIRNGANMFKYTVHNKCYDIAEKLINIDPIKCNLSCVLGATNDTYLTSLCHTNSIYNKTDLNNPIHLCIKILSYPTLCKLDSVNIHNDTVLTLACKYHLINCAIAAPLIMKILSNPTNCNMGMVNDNNETALLIMMRKKTTSSGYQSSMKLIIKKMLSHLELCGVNSGVGIEKIIMFLCDNNMKEYLNSVLNCISPTLKITLTDKYLNNPIAQALISNLNDDSVSEQIKHLTSFKEKVNTYNELHKSIEKKSSCLMCYDESTNDSKDIHFYNMGTCAHIINICNTCVPSIENKPCPVCRVKINNIKKVFVIE